MKKLIVSCIFLLVFSGFAQTNTCSKDIIFNGSWSGGSGPGGAPTSADQNKGISIQSDITITENVNCACLHIENGSTLSIAGNRLLLVKDDLILNGNLRLIGKSQLIQNHTGSSKVSGNGKLHIDQDSNIDDVYRYTYWSSPVVNSSLETTYSLSSILFDGTNPTSEKSPLVPINWKPFNGSLLSLDGAPTHPITIANYWIYTMFNGTLRSDWKQKFDSGLIERGLGFLMKGSGALQNYTFAGTPNDGDIAFNITAKTSSLLGNPYPSALDSKKFLEDNPNIHEIFFFDREKSLNITHSSYSVEYPGSFYALRNRSAGVSSSKLASSNAKKIYTSPGRYIPVGQGFIISSEVDQSVVFKNSQRVFAQKQKANTLFIAEEQSEHSIMKFGFEFEYYNNNFHQQAAISFIKGKTFADELGYDTTFYLPSNNLHFKFPESQNNLIIATIQEVTEGLEFPLSLEINESQTIKLMVDELFNINHSFVLMDKVTGIEYDIKNQTVSLSLTAGTYTNRFFIQFRRPNQELNSNNDVIIYSKNKEVIVKPFNNTSIQSYTVHNVLGQKLISSSAPTRLINETLIRIPTTNFASGIVFVNVQTDKGVFKKKLILK